MRYAEMDAPRLQEMQAGDERATERIWVEPWHVETRLFWMQRSQSTQAAGLGRQSRLGLPVDGWQNIHQIPNHQFAVRWSGSMAGAGMVVDLSLAAAAAIFLAIFVAVVLVVVAIAPRREQTNNWGLVLDCCGDYGCWQLTWEVHNC